MFLRRDCMWIYALLYGIFHRNHLAGWIPRRLQLLRRSYGSSVSASLPAAQNTWMILPLGAAAFLVFYVYSFRNCEI